MEATLIRIGSRLNPGESAAPNPALERRVRHISSETFEYYCYWAGEPHVLQDLILSQVDWGPFDILCEPADESCTGHCRCEVRYYGPPGEKMQLMTSFWGIMESFLPFQSSTHSYESPSQSV